MTAGITAVALALPLGAAVVAAADDRSPVQVSADTGGPEVTLPEPTTTSSVSSVATTVTPRRTTTTTGVPSVATSTVPPVLVTVPFDPTAYDSVAVLTEWNGSGITGWAGQKQVAADSWTITVVADHLVPRAYYTSTVERLKSDGSVEVAGGCVLIADRPGPVQCTARYSVGPFLDIRLVMQPNQDAVVAFGSFG